MGHHVRKGLGESGYRVLVTATGGGSVRSLANESAHQREAFASDTAPAGTLEAILYNPHDERPLFYDLHAGHSNHKLLEYLSMPIGFRSTGSLVYKQEFTLLRPAEQFDGVVYFPRTTASIDPHSSPA